ncbi:hypothetical protein L1987_56846 [Smallanthus sonchifolius]|uniref:Uncharacterized protein n=1 Tax=Smallanthus sonchifolius TaxID=185202 RepID=A0ACB9DBC4_9ASTR|nr:hypothetical protein L1987_56846 [Smallanthus sonchifolius]
MRERTRRTYFVWIVAWGFALTVSHLTALIVSYKSIRRYVYHDVIRVGDAEKLMDCSYVQPVETLAIAASAAIEPSKTLISSALFSASEGMMSEYLYEKKFKVRRSCGGVSAGFFTGVGIREPAEGLPPPVAVSLKLFGVGKWTVSVGLSPDLVQFDRCFKMVLIK